MPSANPSYDQIYRVDYNMSDKWRFFVRALDSKSTQRTPYGRADTSNVLSKSTIYAAIVFFVLAFALYLGRIYERGQARSTGGATSII